MGMQVDKKDLAEKIIEAEIQKTGIPIPELKYQPQGMIFDS